MTNVHAPAQSTDTTSIDTRSGGGLGSVPLWRVNVLRVGYLVVGVGLAIRKWPLLVTHGPWDLAEGTIELMLVALSVLALLGLRHPIRMLPILLFETLWKLAWLGVIALPAWLNGTLDEATTTRVGEILWVVVVMAAVPWRYVFRQYVMARGTAWRRAH